MAFPRVPRSGLFSKGRLLVLIAFLLLLYIVAPQLSGFSDSFLILQKAQPQYIAVALILLVLTYIFAAAIYTALAFSPLNYRQTLLVQIASTFTNRLLPAGLGTLTLYVQYLRMHHHTISQAITVIGTNNLLGITGHFILLAIIVLVTGATSTVHIAVPGTPKTWLLIGVLTLVVMGVLLAFRVVRERLLKTLRETLHYAASYRARPLAVVQGLLLNILFTICYAGIFYMSAQALDVHLSAQALFMAFSIGTLAGAVTPTPGGLVGAEAGLTAGLAAYGVAPETALAVALLHRFLTYWLPLLPAFAVFIGMRRLYTQRSPKRR